MWEQTERKSKNWSQSSLERAMEILMACVWAQTPPPARPSLTTLCWWNAWSESLSKSKMAMRKLQEQDYGAECFDNIFLFKLRTYIKFLTEHRTMGRRGKGHVLDVCNQCVLSLMRTDWNRGWLSGMLRVLTWYQPPLHQSKLIRAMTEKVDSLPQAH